MSEGGLADAIVQFILILLSLNYVIQTGKCEEFKTFTLQMPDVRPKYEDSYFCTSIRVDPNAEFYITAFTPNASMEIAHHMMLIGCEEPGSIEKVWNCASMVNQEPGLNYAPDCNKSQQIMYGWARDAPKLELPDGVAFRIGGKTKIQHLILQVHYASVERFKEDGVTDNSGLIFTYTKTPMPKTASIIYLAAFGGYILPKTTEYFEIACELKEEAILHPIAFRVHTHELGKVVAGFKVEPSIDPLEEKWTLLGKKDPQLPQMFYPVQNDITVKKGDVLAVRCTMENTRDNIVRIGGTAKDEMCNFYLMYWVEGEPIETKVCASVGPPYENWARHHLKAIPNDIASSLPVGESAIEQGYFEKAF